MPTILLIEPDRLLAKQYMQALQKREYEVVCAVEAEHALRQIDETEPVAIILELQLGQHNGLEFLYEIRSYDDLRTLPVIILSSVEPDHIVSVPSYKYLQISAYLYKPDTTLDRLCKTLDEVVGSERKE